MAKPRQIQEVKNPTGEVLRQALDFVGIRLAEIEPFAAASPYGDDWQAWSLATLGGVKHHFGQGSDEYHWVQPSVKPPIVVGPGADRGRMARVEQKYYSETVQEITNGLRAIIEKYRALGPLPSLDAPVQVGISARGFISHGGRKASLNLIEDFLRAIGVDPVVVEKRASEGREVHENVDKHRRSCHFAVVVWTRDVRDSSGSWTPSGSVAVEAGELREQFKGRVIYLREEDVKLPAMGGTIVYETFSENNMGPAYLKIVTELHGWGWLNVVPEHHGTVSAPATNGHDLALDVPGDTDLEAAEEGVWDWLEQVGQSLEDANGETVAISTSITVMGEDLKAKTEQVEKLVQDGRPSPVRAAIASAAASIIKNAADIEKGTPKFRDAWRKFGSAATSLTQSSVARKPENEEGLRTMLVSLEGLIPSFDAGLEGVQTMRTAVLGLKGYSRDLNYASDRSLKSLNALLAEMKEAQEICRRVRDAYAIALNPKP